MAESKEFKLWHKLECARHLGNLSELPEINYDETLKTYNFKEKRVKNHVTGKTSYNLKEILDGDIEA